MSVRSHLEDVALTRHLTILHSGNFLTDRDESLAEAVQLGLAFGFGGLNHECVGDGPGHSRSVETVVL